MKYHQPNPRKFSLNKFGTWLGGMRVISDKNANMVRRIPAYQVGKPVKSADGKTQYMPIESGALIRLNKKSYRGKSERRQVIKDRRIDRILGETNLALAMQS